MVFIHRKTKNCTVINNVRFFPGMNTISDSEYVSIKELRAFKEEFPHNMTLGSIVESEASNAVESNSAKERAMRLATEIRSIALAKATESIAALNDAEILKFLKEIDGRKGIQDAIDKRLIAIKAQIGDDLKSESKIAPEGDGSDFKEKIGTGKEDLEGGKVHSAIPALKAK
jgi:hypothetical protein